MKNSLTRRSMLWILAAGPIGAGGIAGAQPAPGENEILCRVLEARTVTRMGLNLVIFHQAKASEGRRLGEILRARDGTQGEFQTPDGWRAATILRLGSCFGRGLLIFPSSTAHLANRQQFLLRFSDRSPGSRTRREEK